MQGIMSRELYEAEYETSMKAYRMLKDLVKNDMAKGQALDQVEPCPKESLCNGPTGTWRPSSRDTGSLAE